MSGKTMVTLVGFMGCGKTTVGAALAAALGVRAVDADRIIEEREGRSITRIFEEDGEGRFRDLERETVAELCSGEEPMVLCSGGGAVLDDGNIDNFKKAGPVVWLRATPESIWRRISEEGNRPVLKNGMTVENIAARLEARLPRYRKAADIIIDTDGKDPESIAGEIAKLIADRRQAAAR